MKSSKQVLAYPYICSDCAKKRGAKWPKGHQATSHYDLCMYCAKTKALCAVTDWLWNGAKVLRAWD